ncbi:MAG: SpoIIE family protein phosphatase [Clostridia bacterium]|nr:SpoIIE family protein phosphatase [Clostridia bacterium]
MDQFEIYPYRRTTPPPRTEKAGKGPLWRRVAGELRKGQASVWEGLKQLLAWHSLVVFIIAFLSGRALLLQELHPFAPAYVAAVYSIAPVYTVAAIAGTGLGLYSVAQGAVFWGGIANLFFVWIILRLVGLGERSGNFALPVLVFASTIIVKTVTASFSSPILYNYVVAMIEAVFAGALTFIARKGLEAGRDAAPLHSQPLDSKLCLSVLALGALTGLKGLEIYGLTLLGIFSQVILLLAVRNGGVGIGAISGTVVGLVPGVAGGTTFPVAVGVYAFSGLMAGVFSRFGRLGAPLGLLLSNIFWSMYLSTPDKLLLVMGETLIAIILYLLMPPLVLLAPKQGNAEPKASPKKEKGDDFTARRLNRFAKVFEELAETFAQLASEGRMAQLREENVVDKIGEHVCLNCSKARVCWENNASQTRKALWNLVSLVELEGAGVAVQSGRGATGHCIHPRELLVAVKCMVSNKQNNQYWQKRLQESQELVSGQLRGVSCLMENLAHETDAGGELGPEIDDPELPLGVELGIARVAKDGAMISGDSQAAFFLRKGKYVVALSDGMGAGPEAAEESRATVSLLTRLLETGFQEDLAVKTVNSALMLRAQEDSFATLDLTVIDLHHGDTDFIKIGAAASFIKRGENIGIIKSTSLPIGILQQMEADVIRQELQPGDIIVMMTDGLLESAEDRVDKEQWIVDVLAGCRTGDPQNLADYLLNRGRQNAGNSVPDDMSVIVIKITENQSSGPLQ